MMKRLLPFIFVTLMSCASSGVYQHNYGSTMKMTSDVVYDKARFDSMCVTDKLPNDLSKWDSIISRDDEDMSAIVVHYLYSATDSTELLYKVERVKYGKFKINKREILK